MESPITPLDQLSEDYVNVAKAIRYLEVNFRRQPELKDIAAHIGFSEYHFQRLFTRWVGISPKRFLQYLTKEYALELLGKSSDVLSVARQTGLSGPGRLHDLLVTCEAVTPGEYKHQGEGLTIRYGFHPTPFGECLLAHTERGICHLAFIDQANRSASQDRLRSIWKNASLIEDPGSTRALVEHVFLPGSEAIRVPVLLNGTNFQIKVWEALLRIPPGTVTTYEEVARSIGKPEAARAVGNAVARNAIPVIIPCHRIIRKDGGLGGYAFGMTRKMALLGWEMARQDVKIGVAGVGSF